MTDDEFTIHHCTEWCELTGIDLEFVPIMVQELKDDGPDSKMSWPTVARFVNAKYTDGMSYR